MFDATEQGTFNHISGKDLSLIGQNQALRLPAICKCRPAGARLGRCLQGSERLGSHVRAIGTRAHLVKFLPEVVGE